MSVPRTAKAIDVYTAASAESEASVDERLRSIIERMFDRCERDGEFKQALGIALVSHRLDVVNRLFDSTKDVSLLEWILQIVIREGVLGGSSRAYRQDVLHLLIKLFSSLDSPDYFAITQCFVYLNDPSLASGLLSSLLSLPMPPPGSSAQVPLASTSSSTSDEDKVLIAYQVAFDLAETATQEFLKEVRNSLNANEPQAEPAGEAGESVAGAEKATSSTNEHRDRVVAILTGEESIKLYLEFLYRNNKSDMLILKKTKDSLEARNSIYHSAVTFMNAFAHAGTTSDQFLRDNLQWLGRASNWSKFSATGALGVIHKGNLAHGMPILQPYLPGNQGSHPSVYSEGGSLYALGLIYANHATDEVLMFLRNAMKDESAGEVVQHGAALGLGAAAMATGSEDIYSDLREVLYSDSAIAGEAAGYAMGLVMLGTASQRAIDEMLQYAHETQHEKIIRGLAIGLSFLMYGKEEEADTLIETLLRDQVRHGRHSSASCADAHLTRFPAGRDCSLRWHPHDRYGVRWHRQQQVHQAVAARRRLGRERRRTPRCSYLARLCPLPQPDTGAAHCSAPQRELQPACPLRRCTRARHLVCRHRPQRRDRPARTSDQGHGRLCAPRSMHRPRHGHDRAERHAQPTQRRRA